VNADLVPTDGAASTLKPPPIFLEGITTDTNGNLYVVDVPYGRVLKLDLHGSGEFSVVAEWDGEPNGLALNDDGTLVVADYKQGVVSDSNRSRRQAGNSETDSLKLRLDPADGKVTPLLTRRNLERFKGPNDLIYAKNGDMCE
jgi:gluconolactonase